MADEPRRSVRATKGQHTKTSDLLDQPVEPKKKGGKRTKKAAQKEAEQEEVELIRCVCGARETSDDDEDAWIACDSCTVWQHNVCMGVSPYAEDTPENYLCEECGPQFHKELLDATARGEQPWIRRRTEFEQEKADLEDGAKRKGKKGKGKRQSDPKAEVSKTANGKTSSPLAVADSPAEKKEPASRQGSAKRKIRDESNDQETPKQPQQKIRKVSTAATVQTPNTPAPNSSRTVATVSSSQPKSPAHGLPVKIEELESSRQPLAKFLQKSLLPAIQLAIKNKVYAVTPKDTPELKAERLAIELDDALYKTHPDKAAYNKQLRIISANLKSNQELCDGLLSRKLTPSGLAVMTSDDMATSEMKRETAEMKARADKQAIMITDDGPRVRRTHKGEELVENDNFAESTDNTISISRRRSMLDPNADMATRSRENSPGNEVELPETIDEFQSGGGIQANALPKQPLSVETKSKPEPLRKASGPTNFDINKVFSSVQSPTNTSHGRKPSLSVAPPAKGAGDDPEIDRLLQDDETDSPPYSPSEETDPDVVWRGTVTMDSVAKFTAAAKYVAGADLRLKTPWTELLLKDLKIAGRIDTEKANEYLCSLRYSPQTDVSVVEIIPAGDLATQGKKTIYEYFASKKRYGVLANKGSGNVRDTYLVPVPASPGKIPDFITNLEGHKVPEVREAPSLLVAVVIRNDYQPPPQFDGPTEVPTPTAASHPQRQLSISGTGPAMSPITTQTGFPPTPTPHAPLPISPEDATKRADDQRKAIQLEGEATAARILGHHVQASTVRFLMPQAFQMRTVEWEIIRDILEQDPKAREDLQHLSLVLEARMAQDGQKSASQGQV